MKLTNPERAAMMNIPITVVNAMLISTITVVTINRVNHGIGNK